MALEIKTLRIGILKPASAVDAYGERLLYEVPVGKATMISGIRLAHGTNVSSPIVSINVFFARKASRDTPLRIVNNPTHVVYPDNLIVVSRFTMEAGDVLLGDASAYGINYVISGVEQDV